MVTVGIAPVAAGGALAPRAVVADTVGTLVAGVGAPSAKVLLCCGGCGCAGMPKLTDVVALPPCSCPEKNMGTTMTISASNTAAPTRRCFRRASTGWARG